jgi:cystathionine gamma-synthase
MPRNPNRPRALETAAVHAARPPDAATGAVAPPLYLTTNFIRDPDGDYRRGYNYIRDGNPNLAALETGLAALDGGDRALATSSGSAATALLFQAAAGRGTIVASESAYHGTLRQLAEFVPAIGGRVRKVATDDLDAVRAVLAEEGKAVALLFVETPANPLLGISDLAALAELAAGLGVPLACDSTFATPVLQRPLDLGAGIVIHSSTKYLGGHGDLMGGALIFRGCEDWAEQLAGLRGVTGAVPSPFDCWLLQRSLPTLPQRVRAQAASARRLADFLSGRPEVHAVLYPGLESHPGHAVAARQMRDFGGMLSFRLAGGQAAALAVAARVEVFTRATSLGGIESLIEHRASIEGPATKTPDDLLRLSIGLEHPDDLEADLAAALAALAE